MEYEVRKLPRKSIVIIAIVVVVGIAYYLISMDLRAQKIAEDLAKVGYENVSDVVVYAKHKMEDKKTKTQGYQYSVEFLDQDTGKRCKGFLLINFDKTLHKNIDCE